MNSTASLKRKKKDEWNLLCIFFSFLLFFFSSFLSSSLIYLDRERNQEEAKNPHMTILL